MLKKHSLIRTANTCPIWNNLIYVRRSIFLPWTNLSPRRNLKRNCGFMWRQRVKNRAYPLLLLLATMACKAWFKDILDRLRNWSTWLLRGTTEATYLFTVYQHKRQTFEWIMKPCCAVVVKEFRMTMVQFFVHGFRTAPLARCGGGQEKRRQGSWCFRPSAGTGWFMTYLLPRRVKQRSQPRSP